MATPGEEPSTRRSRASPGSLSPAAACCRGNGGGRCGLSSTSIALSARRAFLTVIFCGRARGWQPASEAACVLRSKERSACSSRQPLSRTSRAAAASGLARAKQPLTFACALALRARGAHHRHGRRGGGSLERSLALQLSLVNNLRLRRRQHLAALAFDLHCRSARVRRSQARAAAGIARRTSREPYARELLPMFARWSQAVTPTTL